MINYRRDTKDVVWVKTQSVMNLLHITRDELHTEINHTGSMVTSNGEVVFHVFEKVLNQLAKKGNEQAIAAKAKMRFTRKLIKQVSRV